MQPEAKAPVMDIAPPPKAEQIKNETSAEKKPTADPETKKDVAKANDKVTKSKATVEKTGNSAALVVTMTIIIMLLLAGLAVFAYLSSK
jgi:hypothetical protein